MRLAAAALSLTLVVAASPAAAQDEEVVAPLLDPYWTRQVEVVQPRQVEKVHAVELVALAGVIPNDAFLVYIPLGLRAAYHLTERWAIELSFEANIAVDTGLKDYLERSDAQLRAQLRDRQQLRTSLSTMWSPLYGKLALGARALPFDLYVLGGVGIVRTGEEQAIGLDAAVRPDFHLGLGVRAFLGRRWLLRLEVRQYLYLHPEDRTGRGGGVGFPTEIALCSGVLLGGRR
jgi:outer membrane beta-barrel protein